MGLGVYVGSQTKRVARGAKRNAEKLLGSIKSEIHAALDDPLLKQLASFWSDGQTLAVCLHPAEEAAQFTLREDGYLICSAKTSSAGPGYHAMLVELLDRLQQTCGLAWEWDGGDGEFMDETHFAGHRNYRLLQLEMLKLLRATAQTLIQEKEHEHFALSVPMDYEVVGDYFVRSSLGFWERSWFEKVAATEPEKLLAQGAEFYPWWNRQRDALFWKNCGFVKAWVDLPWHAPADATETTAYELTLECFDRARSLDPKLSLPEKEIREIRQLLDAPDQTAYRPASTGVGFRRRVLWRSPFRGWTIQVPGYFYEGDEDDGATAVYWHADKIIRLTTLQVTDKRGKVPTAEELGNLSSDEVPANANVFDFFEQGQRGQAVVHQHADDAGKYWMLEGHMATPGHLGLVTICYDDKRGESWALETWRSIHGPRGIQRR